MTKITSEEFLKEAMEPDFPDSFVLQLNKEHEDGGTFSEGAFEDIARKFQAYVMARTMAKWQKSGVPPEKLRVQVSVSFDNDPMIEHGLPWYSAKDIGEGMDVIDGKRRGE